MVQRYLISYASRYSRESHWLCNTYLYFDINKKENKRKSIANKILEELKQYDSNVILINFWKVE